MITPASAPFNSTHIIQRRLLKILYRNCNTEPVNVLQWQEYWQLKLDWTKTNQILTTWSTRNLSRKTVCNEVAFLTAATLSCNSTHGIARYTSCIGGRAAATICPRPGLQVVTRYTSCTHMDRSPVTVCPCWPVSTTNQSGLVTLTFDHNMAPPPGSWSLTFWPWKWRPSQVWPLCSRVRSDVCDTQTSDRQLDVRQKHRLMLPPIRGGAY